MRRIVGLVLFALLACPPVAQAIRLRWNTCANDLPVAQDARVMLVVEADSSEGSLPLSWRLVWTADSSGLGLAASDTVAACQSDTAKVVLIEPPSTAADSSANQSTARFCSGESARAAVAYWLVDLVAGSKGKLKIVALHPGDSNVVIESNEVTYNGGITGEYAPTILRASSSHESAQLEVTLVGSDLASTNSLRLAASDHLWNVPLTITAATGGSVRAVADVPALLPGGVVEAGSADDQVGVAILPPDQVIMGVSSFPDTILFRDPNPAVYPKDFSFYYNGVPTGNPLHPWKGLFHLIYIRHNKNLTGDAQEPCLAHAWSDSLRGWRVDTLAFLPGSGWDGLHVWAPSIVQVGSEYQMFYTGVDAARNQRIGYATTSLLDTTNTSWTRRSSWVYSADSTTWADPDGLGYGGAEQFRDPFVMADPDNPGRWLMFVTGRTGTSARLPA